MKYVLLEMVQVQ